MFFLESELYKVGKVNRKFSENCWDHIYRKQNKDNLEVERCLFFKNVIFYK